MKFDDYLKIRLDEIVGDTYTKGYLESIISTYYKKDIKEIYKEINDVKIGITKEDLITYRNKLINNKMDITVDAILEEVLKDKKPSKYNTDLSSGVFSRYLETYLDMYSYNFNLLDYYSRYMEIIKKRLIVIVHILNFTEDDIEKYDFDYATKDSFSRFDAERLLVPFVENYTLLNSILASANNYSSYLRKSVPLLSEEDLLVKDLECDDTYGRIRPSLKQQEEKDKNRNANIRSSVKSLFKKN